MTEDELAEFFAQWSDAGDEVRAAWRKELGATGRAKDWGSVAALLAEQDTDVAQEMLDLARWHAEAHRRNATKPRRERARHWRVLAQHLWEKDPDATHLGLFYGVPWKSDEGKQMTLYDGDASYDFWMEEEGGRQQVTCVLPSGLTDSIQFEGLKKHLREQKPGREGLGSTNS